MQRENTQKEDINIKCLKISYITERPKELKARLLFLMSLTMHLRSVVEDIVQFFHPLQERNKQRHGLRSRTNQCESIGCIKLVSHEKSLGSNALVGPS